MKHFNYLLKRNINNMKVGEEFTYKTDDQKYFKKGIKISKDMMIPIGLSCTTQESAEKQY